MHGVELGFEIALGIALFVVALAVLRLVLERVLIRYFEFHAWGQKHPVADIVVMLVAALAVVAGLVIYLARTSH
jgi:hypothetical protein